VDREAPEVLTTMTDTRTATTTTFDAATYVYPWDVIGDPAAPERIAALGVDHVTLAALYHATRALTPRHPAHRVVVADHTAAYLPLDESRWSGAALRPPPQTWLDQRDAFGTAASALAAAGLPSHAWVVINHVDHIDPHPAAAAADAARRAPTVVNAYGDAYSWALCPARDEVRDYAVRMAGQVAAHESVAGIEFEAGGWYGFDHLHAHDKVSGVSLDQAEQFLFSLCFCAACDDEYRQAGVDPAELRTTVRAALDRVFTGEAVATPPGMSEREKIDALLSPHLTSAVLAMRGAVADRLRAEMVAAVRELRPEPDFPILFHANPRPHRSTAFTGLDPATLPDRADGVVLNCWADANTAAESVAATVKSGREGLRVVAGMLAVAGMGATPEGAAVILDAVRKSGASGIRIYHAGLAGPADLALISEIVSSARLTNG
jgi:hypothetical protein